MEATLNVEAGDRMPKGHVSHASADGSGEARVSMPQGQPDHASPLADIIDDIRDAHRARRFAMKVQQKLDRALESFIRLNATDWRPDLPDAEKKRENAKVHALIRAARNGDPEASHVARQVAMTDSAREFADVDRAACERTMEKLAKKLPVYGWAKAVPGFGDLGLATIVAEAGDLALYPTHSKLWKRLGFAPYDGLAGSTWKRDTWRPRALTSAEWTENPFSGSRYAAMHQIAVWLCNNPAQRTAKEKSGTVYGEPVGPYGAAYVHRRDHTASTHPDWSDGHAHMDALRYMMKRLLRDLWQAWRTEAMRVLPLPVSGKVPSSADA